MQRIEVFKKVLDAFDMHGAGYMCTRVHLYSPSDEMCAECLKTMKAFLKIKHPNIHERVKDSDFVLWFPYDDTERRVLFLKQLIHAIEQGNI